MVALNNQIGILRGIVHEVVTLGTKFNGGTGYCALRRVYDCKIVVANEGEKAFLWFPIDALAVADNSEAGTLGTPLHLACLLECDGENIIELARDNFGAIKILDEYGRYPLAIIAEV